MAKKSYKPTGWVYMTDKEHAEARKKAKERRDELLNKNERKQMDQIMEDMEKREEKREGDK